tara:strand:+ start:3175 stop:3654 length:480 start_codon:yes stop_codon:yes gene_type:complete
MTGSDYIKSGCIEDAIMSREWTLNDVLDMDKTVEEIVQNLIVGMDIESKYDIVKDIDYGKSIMEFRDTISVGNIVSIVLREELTNMVQFVVSNYLKTAKVEFKDEDKRQMGKPIVLEKKEDEQVLDVLSQDEKIVTLKEKIRKDSKMLSEKEMKEQGMI